MLFRNEKLRPGLRLGLFCMAAATGLAHFALAALAAPAPHPLRLALSDLQQMAPPADDAPGAFSEPATEGAREDLPDLPESEDGASDMPGDIPAADDMPAADEGASAPDAAATAILYDTDLLPDPTARMRQLIIEAATTGDIEALRPLIGLGPDRTRLAIGAIEDDPIDYLRASSGDGDGQELLAIILDVLDAGYVSVEQEGEEALYLWPYFFAMPLDDLSAPQKVELFRIVTAGDYEEMQFYGGYNFYRIGITASGEWAYFVAGD